MGKNKYEHTSYDPYALSDLGNIGSVGGNPSVLSDGDLNDPKEDHSNAEDQRNLDWWAKRNVGEIGLAP